MARCRSLLIPANPRPPFDRLRLPADLARGAARRDLVDEVREPLRELVDRVFFDFDRLELERERADALRPDDFLARCDFVSPFLRRILFTVRAATSSARPPYRPERLALSLMCLYWRSRFGLAPLGILLFLPFRSVG